jgi:hypothetical protein
MATCRSLIVNLQLLQLAAIKKVHINDVYEACRANTLTIYGI